MRALLERGARREGPAAAPLRGAAQALRARQPAVRRLRLRGGPGGMRFNYLKCILDVILLFEMGIEIRCVSILIQKIMALPQNGYLHPLKSDITVWRTKE